MEPGIICEGDHIGTTRRSHDTNDQADGKKIRKRVPPWEYAGTKEPPCDTQKVNHRHGEPPGVVLSEATRMGESST